MNDKPENICKNIHFRKYKYFNYELYSIISNALVHFNHDINNIIYEYGYNYFVDDNIYKYYLNKECKFVNFLNYFYLKNYIYFQNTNSIIGYCLDDNKMVTKKYDDLKIMSITCDSENIYYLLENVYIHEEKFYYYYNRYIINVLDGNLKKKDQRLFLERKRTLSIASDCKKLYVLCEDEFKQEIIILDFQGKISNKVDLCHIDSKFYNEKAISIYIDNNNNGIRKMYLITQKYDIMIYNIKKIEINNVYINSIKKISNRLTENIRSVHINNQKIIVNCYHKLFVIDESSELICPLNL
jgi:hypothetical protein